MGQEAATRLIEVKERPERVREMRCTESPGTDRLQQQVANSLVLFINYKHYRWQVAGPLSANLQTLFDEFAGEMLGLLDRFSERLCVIGRNPVLDLDAVHRTATVECAAVHADLHELVGEAHRNSRRQLDELRQAVSAAVNEGDPGAADLFSMAVRTHEKHEWSFRRLLKSSADVFEMPSLS
jgi:starvation-inducible DNA-binding protein